MIAEKEAEKTISVLNIIWAAILISLVAYLLIGHYIISGMQSQLNAEAYKNTKYVLYALALICLISSRVAKILLLSSKTKADNISGMDANLIVQKFRVAMITNWVFLELIGIFGLVLFMLGKNPNDLFILLLISVISMLMNRPKKEELINYSNKISSDNTDAKA